MNTSKPNNTDTITARLLDLTTEYAAIDAVSGHEQDLVRRLVADLQSYCDSVVVDAFGNVIGTRTGPESAPSLMVAAHSDEIGAVVKSVEPDGAIRFEPIGGVLETLLVGRAVRVAGINGVIGSRAGHITPIEERRVAPALNDLYVDVGSDSRAGVEDLGIKTGDPIAYEAPVRRLGTSERISGKAIDNRIGWDARCFFDSPSHDGDRQRSRVDADESEQGRRCHRPTRHAPIPRANGHRPRYRLSASTLRRRQL